MPALEIAIAVGGPVVSGAILKLWSDVTKLKSQMAAQEAIVPRIEARLLEIVQELRALRAEMIREYDHKK